LAQLVPVEALEAQSSAHWCIR